MKPQVSSRRKEDEKALVVVDVDCEKRRTGEATDTPRIGRDKARDMLIVTV
jgi:hypothetical protein